MDTKKALAAYNLHKKHCIEKQRLDRNGQLIEMRLSFEEWCKVWLDSGKWELRGNKKGQYCMSRVEDIGHYEVGNVFIQLASDNVRQGQLGRSPTVSASLKRSQSLKRHYENPEARALTGQKSREALVRLRQNPEAYALFKKRCSESQKGRPVRRLSCPHCGKTGHYAAMSRWHFGNCRLFAQPLA